MQFLGELAERLLDFVRACAPRNAQFLVGIARHVEYRSIKGRDRQLGHRVRRAKGDAQIRP
jgi:hypothetical protein